MKLTCINLETNKKAIKKINRIRKKTKKLELFESVFFVESTADFLTQLASEEEKFMRMDKINKAMSHLAYSRYILSKTPDNQRLEEIDALIDETIGIISKNIIYTINNPDAMEA